MLGPLALTALVAAVTLSVRMPRRQLPASSRLSQGQKRLLLLALVPCGAAFGLMGSSQADLRWIWLGSSAVSTLLAVLLWPYLMGWSARRVILLAAPVLGVMLWPAALTWASPLLLGATALGAAALISLTFGGRGCAILVGILTLSDLLLWRAGVLDNFLWAGMSHEMHPWAAVQIAGWALGAGDLLCAALLGAWARSCLSSRGIYLLALIEVSSFAGMLAWAANAEGALPATLPFALSLILMSGMRIQLPTLVYRAD